jgi:hypothetical protein
MAGSNATRQAVARLRGPSARPLSHGAREHHRLRRLQHEVEEVGSLFQRLRAAHDDRRDGRTLEALVELDGPAEELLRPKHRARDGGQLYELDPAHALQAGHSGEDRFAAGAGDETSGGRVEARGDGAAGREAQHPR